MQINYGDIGIDVSNAIAITGMLCAAVLLAIAMLRTKGAVR